jgi:hypothetical protein
VCAPIRRACAFVCAKRSLPSLRFGELGGSVPPWRERSYCGEKGAWRVMSPAIRHLDSPRLRASMANVQPDFQLRASSFQRSESNRHSCQLETRVSPCAPATSPFLIDTHRRVQNAGSLKYRAPSLQHPESNRNTSGIGIFATRSKQAACKFLTATFSQVTLHTLGNNVHSLQLLLAQRNCLCSSGDIFTWLLRGDKIMELRHWVDLPLPKSPSNAYTSQPFAIQEAMRGNRTGARQRLRQNRSG